MISIFGLQLAFREAQLINAVQIFNTVRLTVYFLSFSFSRSPFPTRNSVKFNYKPLLSYRDTNGDIYNRPYLPALPRLAFQGLTSYSGHRLCLPPVLQAVL